MTGVESEGGFEPSEAEGRRATLAGAGLSIGGFVTLVIGNTTDNWYPGFALVGVAVLGTLLMVWMSARDRDQSFAETLAQINRRVFSRSG